MDIDFSPNHDRAPTRSIVLLIGSIVALAATAWPVIENMRAIDGAQSSLRAAQRESNPREIQLSPSQTLAINHAIRQLNLPWEELFTTIESSVDEQVTLLSLVPDTRTHTVRVYGEAKGPTDMFTFIEGLEKQPFVETANLLHHEVRIEKASSPTRFEVVIEWRED